MKVKKGILLGDFVVMSLKSELVVEVALLMNSR